MSSFRVFGHRQDLVGSTHPGGQLKHLQAHLDELAFRFAGVATDRPLTRVL